MTASEVMIKRRGLGIRQDDLADKLGWNTETITDIERGRIQVSEHTLRQMDSAIDEITDAEEDKQAVAA